ncbi:MAG: type II secretion system F family protein [Pirellulaceae bacterium]
MSNWSHTLDDFLALNDEILALSRAGIPLDRNLRSAARQIRGRRGDLLEKMSARLAQGASLDQVVAETKELPPIYRAVVEAGLRSGDLTAALEDVAGVARRMQDVRISYLLAIIYPSIVLMVAGAAIFVVGRPVIRVMVMIIQDELRVPASHPLNWGTQLFQDASPLLSLLCPLGVLLLVGTIAVLMLTQRALLPGGSLIAWVPGLRGVAKFGKQAVWLDVMALLVRRQVPLAEAARLAAASTGDSVWIRATNEWATRLERGERSDPPPMVPGFGRWLLGGQSDPRTLAKWLRIAAETAHREASRKSDWIRARLTLYLGLGLGGMVVGMFAMAMILPWIGIIEQLLREHQ